MAWDKLDSETPIIEASHSAMAPPTTRPLHMVDSMGAGVGRLPEAAMTKRMIEPVKDLP